MEQESTAKTELVLHGFLNDKGIGREKRFAKIANGTWTYDGWRLDALFLRAALTKEQDFDDLIYLLQVHKHCFSNPNTQPKISTT